MEASAAEIDFRKYRRPELTENLSSIVSIPGALRKVGTSAAICLVAAWVIVPALFFQRLHWAFLIPLFFYASLAAAILGWLLGMALVLRSRIDNLLKVVDVTLEISDHVTSDVAELRGGTRKIPSPRRIVYGVYEHVVLPALEGVVRGQSKLLGGVIFRFYRWSLGRLIERALRGAEHSAATTNLSDSQSGATAGLSGSANLARNGDADYYDESDSERRSLLDTLNRVDAAAEASQQWIAEVRAFVLSRGSTLRRVIVVPLAILLGCATLAAVIPIVVVWFMT